MDGFFESVLLAFVFTLISIGLSYLLQNPFVAVDLRRAIINFLILYLFNIVACLSFDILDGGILLAAVLFSLPSILWVFIFAPLVYVYFDTNAQRNEEIEKVVNSRCQCNYKVWTIDNNKLNAWAFGASFLRLILVEKSLIAQLSKEEVLAVMYHEVGHIKYRHVTVFMFLNFFMSVIYICLLPSMLPYFVSVSVHLARAIYAMLFCVIQMILFKFFSNAFEYQADKYSSKFAGISDIVNALEKINKLSHGKMNGWSWTHPTLDQRLKKLE